MPATRKNISFSDDEKALVKYLKEKLQAAGVMKFPQDWHLKQLSTARRMLAGENAPVLAEWVACIDWAFSDPYWRNRVDHLARVLALWPKYKLQGGDSAGKLGKSHREAVQRYTYGNRGEQYANEGEMPF